MKDETQARTRGPEDRRMRGRECKGANRSRAPVQRCKSECASIEYGVLSVGKCDGRRRAAEGRGVASPRPPNKECTINRAPTLVRPAANV